MLNWRNFQNIIRTRSFIVIVIVTTLLTHFKAIGCRANLRGTDLEADSAYISRNNNHGKGDLHDAEYDHKAILGE